MEEMNVPLDARRLLYHETKTVLEQVFISPNSKDVWNFLKQKQLWKWKQIETAPLQSELQPESLYCYADFRYLGFVVMECGALQIGLMRSYGFLSMYGVSY